MASITTWVSWIWPTILLALLAIISLLMPGGPEAIFVLGIIALQGLVIVYKIIAWFVAEANARSVQ